MILKAKKITKTFNDPTTLHLLKDINIEVQRGQTVAIIGRSGEGKSTLLHILGTIDSPTTGEVYIANQLANHSNYTSIRNLNIGFVFQSFYLLEDYSVLQNVLMPARIARKNTNPGSEAYERAIALLHDVGLNERIHHFAKKLSGGEKQRVGIARALCNNPDILLADEPSGNLDHETATSIHQTLLNFAKKYQKTLIVVTHDTNLAGLCDTRYRLSNGTLSEPF